MRETYRSLQSVEEGWGQIDSDHWDFPSVDRPVWYHSVELFRKQKGEASAQ